MRLRSVRPAVVGIVGLAVGILVGTHHIQLGAAGLVAGACLLLLGLWAWALGPGAMRLAGEAAPPSAEERGTLTVRDRIDAVNAARQAVLQSATGIGLILGLVFTAIGLINTAQSNRATLGSTERGQAIEREGQLLNLYPSATSALNSDRIGIRVAAIGELGLIAQRSAQFKRIIIPVLAAFIVDQSQSQPCQDNGEQSCRIPDTDIHTAFTVLGSLDTNEHCSYEPQVNLDNANLANRNLRGFNLACSSLEYANLRNATLERANLTGAIFADTNVMDANFYCANLHNIEPSYGENFPDAVMRCARGLTPAEERAWGADSAACHCG